MTCKASARFDSGFVTVVAIAGSPIVDAVWIDRV